VLLAPPASPQTGDVTGRITPDDFHDAAHFIAAYDEMRKHEDIVETDRERRASAETAGIFGKEVEVRLRAYLIGIGETPIWSIEGDEEGGLHQPTADFIKSFAKTIESSLLSAGFIPKK
jgi:hypothetical protein